MWGAQPPLTSLIELLLNSVVMNSIIINSIINSIIMLSTPLPFPPSPAGEEICNMEPGLSIALVTCCIHGLKEISAKGVREKVKSAVATRGKHFVLGTHRFLTCRIRSGINHTAARVDLWFQEKGNKR